MPRPRKSRKICSHPQCTSFGPRGACGQTISMAIDEYEVVRLIDFEGLTQEQCAAQMEVARTTVQAIYASARKKLAECIVRGFMLHIDGGDIHFCKHRGEACGQGCCRRKNNSANGKDGMF